MIKNHIKNTSNSLPLTLGISLLIATITLSISADAFAEQMPLSNNAIKTQTTVVAAFARYSVDEGVERFAYGAKFITREPTMATITSTTPHIKSIAGIPSREDDCTTIVDVRETRKGLSVTETTQNCVRTEIPNGDLVFHRPGSTVAMEAVSNDAPVTGANFLAVTGGL